jgi:hypothetical protein
LTPAAVAKTFTLTTGVDAVADFTGSAADDVFNATASTTTVNSGDAIDGGLGNDTLNITASATANNSLTGLTATAVETVNIAGGNNLGASSPAFAAAQDAKAVTAAALASAQGGLVIAAGRENATSALAAQALDGITVSSTVGVAPVIKTAKDGLTEAIVVGSSTATVSAAAQLKAAADYIDNVTIGTLADTAAKTALEAIAATTVTAVPTGVTAFTVTQYKAAAAAALTNAAGVALAAGTTTAIAARAAVLAEAATAVDLAAKSTDVDLATAVQRQAAADYIDDVTIGTLADTAAKTALEAIAATTVTAVPTGVTAFTVAQYKAAAAAALKADTGAALAAGTTTAIAARAEALADAAAALVAFEQAHGDFTIGQLNAAASDALSSATGSTLRTNLDDGVAIFVRGEAKASEAVTVLASATTAATTAAANDASAASAVTVALAAVGATSISAAQFADATAITLSGSSSKANVTGVAATQTIGFSGVTGMENSVTFGATVTNGLVSTTGSSGTLTVVGAGLTSLSLAGTTAGSSTTTLSLSEGTATSVDTIKALNVSTTGATVLNTDGLTALTSVTQSGAGGVTLNATGTAAKLATVTTGTGADSVRVTTAVAADTVGTTIDETVTAVVSTGGGNDRVVVETGGTATNGITTVDLGDGDDTLILTSINSGANSLSGGAGNDTFRIGAISTLASTSISAGVGTDVLRTSTATFATADYATLTANVSSIETLQLSANAATLDASRVAMGRIEFFGTGANAVTEVSSAQTIAVVRTPVSAATFGIAAVASAVVPTEITASSKGYVASAVVGGVTVPAVSGDNLKISMTHVSESALVVANANALDLSVTALAAFKGSTSTTDVGELNSKVTVSGDIRTLNATLTSARGSGTRTDLSSTDLGNESIAKLDVSVDAATPSLVALTSIIVSGAGDVTIDASQAVAGDTKLTSINLSGMTAFADINSLGQEIGTVDAVANTVGGFNNLSKSAITLNDNVSETVTLGGGRDTVVTGSTVAVTDTITGFQIVAAVGNPLAASSDRSDTLTFGGATELDATNSVKITVTGSTIEAALLQAVAAKGADGLDRENVVFNFGGNTYFFQDDGDNVLEDTDGLVKFSGTLNLDLLLTSGLITIA